MCSECWMDPSLRHEVLQYSLNGADVKNQEVRWATSNNCPLEYPWVTVSVSFANFDVAIECFFPILTQQLNSFIPQGLSGCLVITKETEIKQVSSKGLITLKAYHYHMPASQDCASHIFGSWSCQVKTAKGEVPPFVTVVRKFKTLGRSLSL